MGKEFTFELSPTQAVQHYFEAKESQPKTIVMHTEAYRQHVKKQVAEGRGVKWGAISTGTEKQKIYLRKFKARHQKRENDF